MSDRDKIRKLYTDCADEVEKLKQKIEKLEKERDRKIKAIRDKCDHVDEGGPFIFVCAKCGLSDSYSELI